mgnify:CR=1 FL=1
MKKILITSLLSMLMLATPMFAVARDEGAQGHNNSSRSNDVAHRGEGNVSKNHSMGHAKRNTYNVGQRLPTQYRSDRYYVTDWRSRHLSEPPRGHRWANVDGSFVLVAVATGIISQVLFAN